MLAAKLGGICFPGGAGFKGMKISWVPPEAWHCAKPGEVIDKGTAMEIQHIGNTKITE